MRKAMLLCHLVLSFNLMAQSLARFRLSQSNLEMAPASQTLILGTDAAFVSFQLSLNAETTNAMIFKAELVGPKIADPITLTLPGLSRTWQLEAGLFPEVGDYALTNLRLEENGEVLVYASSPQTIIQVVDNFLITGVEVREMRRDELTRRGYVFHQDDYRTYEFQLAMITGSDAEIFTIPIALPRKENRTLAPIILEDPLTPKVKVGLISFPVALDLLKEEDSDPSPNTVDFYSLLLIPGEISYLKTHFAVSCVVFNAASPEQNLKVTELSARLRLPLAQAGGLPLIHHDDPQKPVLAPGPDGKLGTGDDINRLSPGEKGRAEFLVSGELEGLYPIETLVSGEIVANGTNLHIQSVGKGLVYVRSADYTLTAEHPDVVSLNEPYDLSFTIHNVGAIPMEDFHFKIEAKNLIGVELNGSDPIQDLGDLQPGEEATIVYHMRSKQTGRVMFSYFEAEGSSGTSLSLYVAVGENGERLSSDSLILPKCFYEQVPAPLVNTLRRYFKKLWDFAATPADKMPLDLGPLKSSIRTHLFVEHMAQVAFEKESGLDDAVADSRLAVEWLRSTYDSEGIDQVRRYILEAGNMPMEAEFGELLHTSLAGFTDDEILKLFAEAASSLQNLRLAMVHGTPSEIRAKDETGAETNSAGKRGLRFSSILPLGEGRALIWLGGQQDKISLELRGSLQSISWLYTNDEQRTLAHADLSEFETHRFEQELGGVLRWKKAEQAGWTLDGVALGAFQPRLYFAKQFDPTRFGETDLIGRDLAFAFNVSLDLSSLEPLEEHFFINDQPVTAVVSPEHQRFLAVSAPMPLGPYKPIRYRIKGLKTAEGTPLPDLEGIVEASNQFYGVTAVGRVVDHQAGNLAGAKVFLMQDPTRSGFPQSNDFIPLGEGEAYQKVKYRFPIVQEINLDETGAFNFDFIATDDYRHFGDSGNYLFKIGVLLADGRYREQEFNPANAIGAEIHADFAFGAQGKIYGQVIDRFGNGIPFAPIYVISQTRGSSTAVTHADEQGFYQVEDIDVGHVLVKSLSGQSLGRASDFLTAMNSPLKVDVQIFEDLAGVVSGRVFYLDENNREVPLKDAWVGVLMDETFEVFQSEWSYNLPYTAGARTDENGLYRIEGVKTGVGLIRFYHPDFAGKRENIDVAAGENPNHDWLSRRAPRGFISGRVIEEQGQAVPNVTVSVGSLFTVTDANGSFSFDSVPLGIKTIHARVKEKQGRATVHLEELALRAEGIVVTLYSPIQIQGTLSDADGKKIPYTKIMHYTEDPETIPTSKRTELEFPDEDSAKVTMTDAYGNWKMSLEPLSDVRLAYRFTAEVAPSVAEKRFLSFPVGQVSQVDLITRRRFPLTIQLVDSYGNPAKSLLKVKSEQYSLSKANRGSAVFEEHRPTITDDQGFVTLSINEGHVQFQGENLLLGNTPVVNYNWMTPEDAANPIVVAFPSATLAQLFGRVYDVDGTSPAPMGTKVQVEVPTDGGPPVQAVVETDEQGNYRFDGLVHTNEPALVTLTYFDEQSGKFYSDRLLLDQSLHFRHDVVLKGRNRLQIHVVRSDGSPIDFAAVSVTADKLELLYAQLEIKGRVRRALQRDQITPDQEFVSFDAPAGEVQIHAVSGLGLSAMRTFAIPGDGSTIEVTLRLEQASSISGVFVNGTSQPILDGEVGLRLNNNLLSQLLSGSDPGEEGRFAFPDLPMRSYSLHGEDPLTAQVANLDVTTTPFEPHQDVKLQIESTIELLGKVLQNGQPLVGAEVKIGISYGQSLVTGTNAEGQFRFLNLAPGTYSAWVHREGHRDETFELITLDRGNAQVIHDIHLEDRVNVHLTVLGYDLLPKAYVSVSLYEGSTRFALSAMTDANGQLTLPMLRKRRTQLQLFDPATDRKQEYYLDLSSAESEEIERTLALDGWGSITGYVRDGLGTPLYTGVSLFVDGMNLNCDENGFFRVAYLPLHQSLDLRAVNMHTLETASRSIQLTTHGEEQEVELTFTPTARVSGQIQLQTGAPVAEATLAIFRPIYREISSDAQGHFELKPLLIGDTPYKITNRNRDRIKRGTFHLDWDGQNPPENQENLVLQFDPASTLSGDAHFSDGELLRSGTVKLLDLQGHLLHETTLLGDGSWHFPLQPVGQYQLVLTDSDHLFESSPLPLVLESESQNPVIPLQMPNAWQVSGQLVTPDGTQTVAYGWVELWKQVAGRDRRVYAGDLNDQGYFDLTHVYPGDYILKAWDEEHTMLFEGLWTVGDGDKLQDVNMQYRSSLYGTVADQQGVPMKGVASLWQGNLLTRVPIAADGSFLIENLVPGPYSLRVQVGGGWFDLVREGTLEPDTNQIAVNVGQTINLSGQAYVAASGIAGFKAEIFMDGIARPVGLDPSGQFLISQVPVNRALFLKLFAGSLHKIIPLGLFTEDTDLGVKLLEPIQLDKTPPQIQFADANQTIRSLPYHMRFEVSEDDPGSRILEESAELWINGQRKTSLLHFREGGFEADFNFFDLAMRRGDNTLSFRIANSSNNAIQKDFHIQIEQEGTVLLCQLLRDQLSVSGTVKLDQDEWSATDNSGFSFITKVSAGTHEIKARNADVGIRKMLQIQDSSLTQEIRLDLKPVGEYRGRVYGEDGVGVAGALVMSSSGSEITDQDGNYRMDLLPLNSHRIIASKDNWMGQLDGPSLSLPNQIALRVDLELHGRGVVTGRVLDGPGGNPVPQVAVNLAYTAESGGLYIPGLSGVTDANGVYRFEDVLTYEFIVSATDWIFSRYSSVRTRLAAPGDVLEQDLIFEPASALNGRILHADGSPAAGFNFEISYASYFSASVTSAADGRFSASGLPNKQYLLIRGSDSESSEFLNFHQTLNGTVALGDLTLQINQPPRIENLPIPSVVEPRVGLLFNGARFADDYRISQVIFEFSGVYSHTEILEVDQDQYSIFWVRVPTLPEGNLHAVVSVVDFLGLTTTQEMDILVQHDTSGPVISLSEPSANSTWEEGSSMRVKGRADDAQNIDTIRLLQDGKELASNRYSTLFDFNVLVPGVSETSGMNFEIEATDREGHLSLLSFPVIVTAKTSENGPEVVVSSPVDKLPLPLHLPEGLDLLLKAQLQDPDGLAYYEWRQGSTILASGTLSGPDAEVQDRVHLPTFDSSVELLDLELKVYDLGDNFSIIPLQLRNIEGIQPSHPLVANAYDTSLEHQSLILSGGTHVLDGKHEYQNLILVNGAILTQSATKNDESFIAHTELRLAEKLVIEATSAIQMDHTGFPNRSSYVPPNGSAYAYAGAGSSVDLASIYGSFLRPEVPGSAGGGGQLRVMGAELWLDGEISASPLSGGTGGSIWLTGDQFFGKGVVRANGFNDRNIPPEVNTSTSGGRVRIDGAFSGSVVAYGGSYSGAGTVYLRVPDPSMPDGVFDKLVVSSRADISARGMTWIPVLTDLLVGTDVQRSQYVDNGQVYETLEFLTPIQLPWQAFVGMRVYREGDLPNGDVIETQLVGSLRTAAGGHFGAFTTGDKIRVDFRIDEIEISDTARYLPSEHWTTEKVRLRNAIFYAPQGSDQPQATLIPEGDVFFEGQSSWGFNDLSGLTSLNIQGELGFEHLHLTQGNHFLNGRITAHQFELDAGAILEIPSRIQDAILQIRADQIRIDGIVRATEQTKSSYIQGFGHGGLVGNETGTTFGSLYEPAISGGGNYNVGGVIQLEFESLLLNGLLDASAKSHIVNSTPWGSGGSILLKGQTLSGNGEVRANGSASSIGAGGRVAVLVDQISDFQGQIAARNDLGSSKGGTGTVFYQTQDWPLGRLVIDQFNTSLNTGAKTLLPGLGQRTATQATGGGPLIQGENFPNSLAGLYLSVAGHEPVRIASNTATELRAAEGQSFPSLQPGESYSAIHLINRLEVLNGALFASVDPIQLTEPIMLLNGAQVQEGTLVQAPVGETNFEDGDYELPSGNFLPLVTVNNATLRINHPSQVGRIELSSTAKLVITSELKVQDLEIDGGYLEFKRNDQNPALIAGNVLLRNGATWTVAPRESYVTVYPIVAEVTGLLSVDASSSIRAEGLERYRNYERSWDGKSHGWRGNGGFERSFTADPMVGSFAKPEAWGSYVAGSIHIQAHELELEGEMTSECPETVPNYLASGGSIWLESPNIRGNGRLSVKGHSLRGGGRIAIYCGADTSFLSSLTLQLGSEVVPSRHDNMSGVGTLFLKRSDQAYGSLIIDQLMPASTVDKGFERAQRLQGITGLKEILLEVGDDDPDPLVVRDLSWTQLPPGLAGLFARMEIDGQRYEARIAENTYNSLRLEDPLPALIPVGTRIQFVLKLDQLVLKNGAMLSFPGLVEAQELITEGLHVNSIWASDYLPSAEPFQLNNQRLRLILDEPNWAQRDLELVNSQLYFDKPIQVHDIQLTNSQICKSLRVETPYMELFKPDLELVANDVTADADSGFSAITFASQKSGSHGGYNGSAPTYDNFAHPTLSLVQPYPQSYLRLNLHSLTGGTVSGRSVFYGASGASVDLQAGNLAGDIHFDVSAPDAEAGRIAVHYDSIDPDAQLSFDVRSEYESNTNTSAGTAFYRGANDRFGHLIIDNGPNNSKTQSTPLPTIGIRTLSAGFSLTPEGQAFRLKIPGLTLNENFRDYYLTINADKARSHLILDSGNKGADAEFLLATDPGTLVAGDQFQLAIWLDSLTLGPNASIGPSDLLIFDEQPPELLAVEIPDQVWPGENFAVSIQAHDNISPVSVSASFEGQTQTAQAPANLTFMAPSPELAGDYPIEIELRDQSGYLTTEMRMVHVLEVDMVPPQVSLLEPLAGTSYQAVETFVSRIQLDDNRELAQVSASFAGQTQVFSFVGRPASQEVSFEWTVPQRNQDTNEPFAVQVTDGVGLETAYETSFLIHGEDPAATMPAPEAYWTLNGIDFSGSAPRDVIGGRPALLSAGSGFQTAQAPHYGYSYLSSSNTAILEVAEPPKPENGLSLAIWVKIYSFKENGGIATFGNATQSAWALKTQTTGGNHFTFSVGAEQVQTSTITTPTAWHFLVASFQGGQLSLYLDGVLEETKSAPFNLIPYPSTSWLQFGVSQTAPVQTMYGCFDEPMIWTQGLNPVQVDYLYQNWQNGTLDLRPPEPITALKAVASTSTLDFQWTASVDRDADLAAYVLAVDGLGEYAIPATSTSFHLDGLTAETTYRIRVNSVDQLGNRNKGVVATFATKPQESDWIEPRVYYTFDNRERASLFTNDARGNLLANNTSKVSITSGMQREANLFSGNNALLETVESPLLGSKSFAFSLWVNVSNYDAGRTLLSLGTNSQEFFSVQTESKIGTKNAKGFRFQLGDRTGSTFSQFGSQLSDSGVLDREVRSGWNCLGLNFDQGHLALYLNGEWLKEVDLSANLASDPFAFLRIGQACNLSTNNTSYNGYLDEFLYWDRTLPPAYFSLIYQSMMANDALDFRPPEPVTTLKADPELNALALNWTASKNDDHDIAGYKVLVEGVGEFDVAHPNLQYRVTGLSPLTNYRVTLAPYDIHGNQHAGTSGVFATLAPLGAVPQPKIYYSLDSGETTSNSAQDLSGNVPANYLNASYSDSVVKQARYFSSASHVMESVESDLLTSKTFALDFWFRSGSFAADSTLLSLGTRSQELFSIREEVTNHGETAKGLRFVLGEKTSTNRVSFGSDLASNGKLRSEINSSMSHHLGLNFDQGHLQVFLDGEKVQDLQLNANLASNPLAFLSFARSSKIENPCNMMLDEFHFWDQTQAPEIFALLHELGRNGTTLDFKPPAEATNLKIQPTATELNLSWTAPTTVDFDHYSLRVDGGEVQQIAKGSAAATVTNLSPGQVYQLELKTVDTSGNQSHGLLVQAATLPEQAQRVQPYAYWSFDTSDRVGYLPKDLRGHLSALYGTASASTNVSGDEIFYLGNGSYYVEAQAPVLDLEAGFAFSTWMKPSSFNNDAILLSLGDLFHESLSISLQNTGGYRFRIQLGDLGSEKQIDAGATMASNGYLAQQMTANQWQHLVLSVVNDELTCYLNGSLVAVLPFTPQDLPLLQDAFLSLGKRTNAAANAYTTSFYINETTFWNEPLSPYWVSLLYEVGTANINLKSPVLDLAPPLEASNLTAIPGVTELQLQWSPSSSNATELAGYRVYLDQDLLAERNNTTTQVTLDNLTPQTSYEARITTFDSFGNESAGLFLPVATLPDGNLTEPVSYWSIDRTSKRNNLFQDLMGRNHAISNVGNEYSGISRECWNLNNSNHKIEFAGSESLDTLDSFTLAAWVYPRAWTQNAGLMTYGSDTLESYGLVLGNDNGYSFRLQTSGANGAEMIATPPTKGPSGRDFRPLLIHNWYQVSATFDHGQVALYLNGRKLSEASWNTTQLPLDALRSLVLGLHQPGVDVPFNGLLDELAVWNQALTEAELRVYYLRGLRHTPLWQNNDAKDGVQLADSFQSPESFEDHDNIVLVNEDLSIGYFQTAKRLWLRNSHLEVEGQLEARSIHLLEGSSLSQPGRERRQGPTRLLAEHLQVDAASRIDFSEKDGWELELTSDASDPQVQLPAASMAAVHAEPNQIRAHELLLDGEINAGQDGTGQQNPLDLQVDVSDGSGQVLAKPAQLKPAPDSQQPPAQPLPEQNPGDLPQRDDKAVLPKSQQRPQKPGPNDGKRDEAPGRSPGPEPHREGQETLRVKGSRKQEFKWLKSWKGFK